MANTFAMDMALKRQQYQINLVNAICNHMVHSLVMVQHDERDRIVIPYNHPNLTNITTTCFQNSRGFIISRWK